MLDAICMSLLPYFPDGCKYFYFIIYLRNIVGRYHLNSISHVITDGLFSGKKGMKHLHAQIHLQAT